MGLTVSRQDDEVMAEINITPFTDVLLVLLIIFMILASLVTPPGFQKELPNKPPISETQQDKQKEIDIEVSEKGIVFVDGRKTDAQGVYGVIAETVRKRGKLHVAITADAKAKYDIIIKILDAARISGLEDVGFVTS